MLSILTFFGIIIYPLIAIASLAFAVLFIVQTFRAIFSVLFPR